MTVVGAALAGTVACGPDPKPEEPCSGPSFNLVVRTAGAALPSDTRINVRYGGNREGEAYSLGDTRTPQAVFCTEDASAGGAPTGGPQARPSAASSGEPDGAGNDDTAESVWALRCRLYTQGPARLDVTASGYEPVEDEALSLADKNRCRVEVEITLEPEQPKAN